MTHATPGSPMPRGSFIDRLMRVCRLDASVFEEVEQDASAIGQAAGVIALGALAQGLGSLPLAGAMGLVAAVIGAFVGWFGGTAVIWLIGVRLMGHTSNYPELLRTIGFASVPQVLLVLGILPLGPLRGVLQLVVGGLVLVAYVVAVRQALDVTTGRAIVVCLLALLLQILLISLLISTVPGLTGAGQPGVIPAP